MTSQKREEQARAHAHTERYMKYRTLGERLSYESHFKAGWDAAVEEALRIAEGVRDAEVELHQTPFGQLPEMNRYFALGALRAADDIRSELGRGA